MRCDCCGSVEELISGELTEFDEYEFICDNCLYELYLREGFCDYSYEELAMIKLGLLNLNSDKIYGFTIKGSEIMVEWLSDYNIESTTLVKCDSMESAIEVVRNLF